MNSEELPNPEQEVVSTTSDDAQEVSDEPVTVAQPSETESIQEEKITAVEESTPSESESLVEPVAQESVNEQETPRVTESEDNKVEKLTEQVAQLERQKETLEAEIKTLQESKTQILSEQVKEAKETLGNMIKEGMRELEGRKQALQMSIEQLERRRERIREEMRTSFAGVSQDLAIRVQGFKDYLVGSLQDLAVAAEQLELPVYDEWERPKQQAPQPQQQEAPKPQFSEQGFQEQARRIREILDQYRTRPDYYGPPWQLRRTFEPIHAERVRNWFFSQGGRGAIRTMGSRLQNILIASAVISVLHNMYGDRSRTLLLANTPERLGEWRRGLQDCLGISRSDFGPERGIVLFEATDALVQKADRLVEDRLMPLVIIDETEDEISLSLLQFPLWLAFAPDPQQTSSYMF
ncbi:MAG: DUF3086 domain-containing protein [Moorea sp. SIO2B7]|nr:DUF3086 domain-containing protein [Moorena sp. SIO2B7]